MMRLKYAVFVAATFSLVEAINLNLNANANALA